MDKYRRQSEKSNLWARRRNTTADLLLDGQLRYLERRHRQGMKQYLRNKVRLQEELQDLVNVSDNGYLDTMTLDASKPPTRGKTSENCGLVKLYSKGNFVFLEASGDPTGQADSLKAVGFNFRSEQSNNEQRDSSSCAAVIKHDNICNLSLNLNKTLNNSFPSYRVSANTDTGFTECLSSQKIPYQVNEGSKEKGSGESSLGFSQRSRSAEHFKSYSKCTCRFTRDNRRSKSPCKHFPCSLPCTYHTLGFSRTDLAEWYHAEDNNDHSDVSSQDSIDEIFRTKAKQSVKQKHEIKRSKSNASSSFHEHKKSQQRVLKSKEPIDDSAKQGDQTQQHVGKTSDSYGQTNPDVMGTVSTGNKPLLKREFSLRPASGPAFGPKPADPILERVRHGVSRAMSTDKQAPRMTVAGRMRGLRALIMEMREKHERSKPVDWAVNYVNLPLEKEETIIAVTDKQTVYYKTDAAIANFKLSIYIVLAANSSTSFSLIKFSWSLANKTSG
ncbi:hypothetical protein PoB_007619400 [Plakobranchus ocellatus]|uniref:SWIM-type domain-containing protein n=1 Tax=Plakobranchus ocellatus TaxID=259542 RepID=A0AAV4DZM4_9GAST|nr:hypothetical protein PoB_007619400 [Plakobranchus ocellatus]